ncbi:hypothetical protein LH442_02385 [Laribacter hongkongensis]|uniref:hypothetical protein n=1 Tax=Laribacter hongkongensis TaxID=168471 RepID=UPI001EFD7B53|nr:hypothetical protein [Laribacter hongkongensis]MCG9054850.1 hypothetical protein [Laribacter hongkongensis]
MNIYDDFLRNHDSQENKLPYSGFQFLIKGFGDEYGFDIFKSYAQDWFCDVECTGYCILLPDGFYPNGEVNYKIEWLRSILSNADLSECLSSFIRHNTIKDLCRIYYKSVGRGIWPFARPDDISGSFRSLDSMMSIWNDPRYKVCAAATIGLAMYCLPMLRELMIMSTGRGKTQGEDYIRAIAFAERAFILIISKIETYLHEVKDIKKIEAAKAGGAFENWGKSKPAWKSFAETKFREHKSITVKSVVLEIIICHEKGVQGFFPSEKGEPVPSESTVHRVVSAIRPAGGSKRGRPRNRAVQSDDD